MEKTAHYPSQKAPLPNLGNLSPGWEPMPYSLTYSYTVTPKKVDHALLTLILANIYGCVFETKT